MRHFSSVSTSVFQSYTINGGEYGRSKDRDYPRAVVALAKALEVPVAVVRSFFSKLRPGSTVEEVLRDFDGEWSHLLLVPNEARVLVDFFSFFTGIDESDEADWSTKTSVFTYHNLNTGKSFVWVHFSD